MSVEDPKCQIYFVNWQMDRKQVRKLNWKAEPNSHSTTPNQTHPYKIKLNHTKPNSSIPNRIHPHQTKLIHTKQNQARQIPTKFDHPKLAGYA